MTEEIKPLGSVEQTSEKAAGRVLRLEMYNWIRILIIAALVVWLFYYEIYGIVYRWVTDSSWSHGFLIPLFSLYFLNQNKKQILSITTKPNYLGLLCLVFLIMLYPVNIVFLKYGYGRPLTMIAGIGAIVLFLGGWKLVRYTWLPVAYLVFAVPLPERYYRELTDPMRGFAASVAAGVLNLVKDLEVTATGVVIDVVYKGQKLEPALDVAEACSGMRLLLAFLALGVAMAYLHYRPAWQRIVLLCSTIPIAILCNIVRVTMTGFIYIFLDPRYAQGVYHDMLGMAMLPLAFGLYGFLAWFMGNLFVEEHEPPKPDVIISRK
ncbi:MAG: exosortase/archaeosortase family protein [Planctomycetota bacterium]